MARIIFPEDFPTQKALAKLINDKHVADGAGSVITAFMAEQDIVLADVLTDAGAAEVLENDRAQLRRDSENNREKRDLTFLAHFNGMKNGVQVLKAHYKPAYHKLGDWSINVTGLSRIAYPQSFADREALVLAFYTKHLALPAGTSPLQPWVTENNVDPTDVTTNILPSCVAFDSAMTAKAEQSENKREQRDNLWNPRLKQLRDIGEYLIKLYAHNPKNLGLWGFVVDDSPRKPKLRKSKILLSETKTVTNVVIGSTFHNTGTTTLIIYKGATTTPVGITVLAGERYGVTAGWGTITVQNTNSLQGGSFTTLAR